jgi:hypothetical protein
MSITPNGLIQTESTSSISALLGGAFAGRRSTVSQPPLKRKSTGRESDVRPSKFLLPFGAGNPTRSHPRGSILGRE